MSIQVVYAIVKAGGRQEKVSVGDVVVVDKLAGEIGDEKGPKINILKFKNKTGFRKRQGHRAQLTAVKVTAIK